MEHSEMTWYFNENKLPICASFLDEFDCEREQCQFSHDEPIFYAKISIPQTVLKSMDNLIAYLQEVGINQSIPITQLIESNSIPNGHH